MQDAKESLWSSGKNCLTIEMHLLCLFLFSKCYCCIANNQKSVISFCLSKDISLYKEIEVNKRRARKVKRVKCALVMIYIYTDLVFMVCKLS